MAWSPLSTYIIVPDIEQAKGEAKNAAVLPTSSADTQHECVREDKWCIQVNTVSEVRSSMPVVKTAEIIHENMKASFPDMWSTSNLQNTTLWIANLDRDPKRVKKVCKCYKCLLYFPINNQVLWGNNTVCSVRAWNDRKSMEFPTEVDMTAFDIHRSIKGQVLEWINYAEARVILWGHRLKLCAHQHQAPFAKVRSQWSSWSYHRWNR